MPACYRAYPSYLIRYYKGPRIPSRTRFQTQQEAVDFKMRATVTTVCSDIDKDSGASDDDGVDRSENTRTWRGWWKSIGRGRTRKDVDSDRADAANASEPLWMFEGNGHDEQEPFGMELQSHIEAAYLADPQGSFAFTLEGSPWTYDLDFSSMTQTNRDHPDHRQRRIRRVPVK